MSDPEFDLRSLPRLALFPFVCLIVGISPLVIITASLISNAERILSDMLAGKALPGMTRMLFELQPLLMALSWMIPLLGFLLLFIRHVKLAYFSAGILLLVSAWMLIGMWFAILVPLISIVTHVGGGP